MVMLLEVLATSSEPRAEHLGSSASFISGGGRRWVEAARAAGVRAPANAVRDARGRRGGAGAFGEGTGVLGCVI